MKSRSGGELFVRDLALSLNRLGHSIVVYAPVMGDMVEELHSHSICCATTLDAVTIRPEIIIGSTQIETVLCLAYFPDVPVISICHDRVAQHGQPPIFSRVRAYVAVDAYCEERLLLEHGIPPSKVTIINNGVDLERFLPRSLLPDRPKLAAIFSNYATLGSETKLVRQVCAEQGIKLHVIGVGSNNQAKSPEDLLYKYDLVFAKARCAMEAMVVGCAVILLNEGFGMAGLVTTNNVADWQPWNFGRKLLLKNHIRADLIRQEIDKYSADDAKQVSYYMREHCSLEVTASAFEKLAVNSLADMKYVEHITLGDEHEEFSKFENDNLRLLGPTQNQAQLSVQAAILQQQLKQSTVRVGLLQQQLTAVYTSYSWRLTRPLRCMLQQMMKLRRSNR